MTSSTPVLMPQLGLEVNEGIVNELLVEVGAHVVRDQPLMELETDKAITEVVAPADGTVLSIEVAPGDTVAVGAVLMHLASEEGATPPAPSVAPQAPSAAGNGAPPAAAAAPAPVAAPSAAAASAAAPSAPIAAPSAGATRLRVAPVARRAAEKLGVDLFALEGTGPRGRITLYDVERAAANGVPKPVEPGRIELTATRRAIARRMTASQQIPQYHLVREVDATHLLATKQAQAAAGVNDLLIQAIAETATRHPLLVTAYVEDDPPYLLQHPGVDVGLAVATDKGLVVPVIRAAHEHGLAAIAADRKRLVGAARDGRLSLGDMSGGAITLSSLAALGVDRFTAMVNPGESTIVAVGKTVDRFVPRGRTIAVVPTLTLTLSFDHRVVDGAAGAEALQTLAELLEGGMTWRP
jgi:pyruvate/2-oxoglutarate dehydrogenase complex dihydrolipoamide acyltransferase (E2) component